MPITSIADVHEDALNLAQLMDGVLERAVAGFESYNVPLPNRRYWTMGSPSIDCEQLVVAFIQMYLGPPGDEASRPQRCNSPRSAVLQVSIARSIPVVGNNGKAPAAEKIQEGSQISAVDAWTLMQIAADLDGWDDTGFGLGVISTVEAPVAEGGFQVVNMQLTLGVP
jgi:hypothetical protein